MLMKKKLELLSKVMSSLEKQFGTGAIMRLDGESHKEDIDIISTGSLALNKALGIGGYPKGRITEIFGPESSGKSTLALHAVRECQKNSGVAAYIDTEHALDTSYAEALGIQLPDLLLSQPDSAEQALEIIDALVHSGVVDLIILDSVAALVPSAELEGDMGDNHPGLQARLMSQALRKLVGNVHKYNTTVIFINQLRHKIGVFYGSPEVTTGGNALKFYASVRLDIRKIASIKHGDHITGHRVRVKTIKNKFATPFQQAEFDIRYGLGIDQIAELLDVALEEKIVEKTGAWYRFEDEQIGQGREKTIHFIREHPELESKIRAKLQKPTPQREKSQLSSSSKKSKTHSKKNG